jgi:putative aldouronate transport system substrate-binding protein
LVPFAQQVLGAPNVWAEESGKFTSALEAPETKQAIDFVAGMWKEGLVHPDAIASPLQMPTWFAGKKVAMSGGGVAPYWRGVSSHHMTALKKASPDRIREILGVFNWLAAPFGTQEYLLKIYGIEGRNYTRQGGDPVPIPHQEELMWFLGYMTNPAEVLYAPGHDDVAKRQHEVQEQVMPTAVANPTEGLVSATQLKSGAAIQKKIHDVMADIITARKPLSTWDDAVKQWKSGGGDAMRQEYEAAFAETR